MSFTFSVYKITNTVNGKGYIGRTGQPLTVRWSKHCSSALAGSNYALHRAIRKYGPGSFSIELLDRHTTLDGSKKSEKAWIKHRRTMGKYGYNMTEGGEGIVGFQHRPESIAKMQAACVGRKPSAEALRRSAEVRRGKKFPHSEETIAKMKAAAIGRRPSPDAIQRAAEVNRGKKRPQSPETIEKIRARALQRWSAKKSKDMSNTNLPSTMGAI